MHSKIFVAFFKGEPQEIQAREEIVATIMNKENLNLSGAIMVLFDTGFEVWAERVASGEVKELWGLAKLEVAARRAFARQKTVSEAVKAVGEEALVEEALRGGMEEEETRRLIAESLKVTETKGESKSRKMQKWLSELLEERGPMEVSRVKEEAIEQGIMSSGFLEVDRDWNLMQTIASQYGFRGKERGIWEK